MLVVEGLTKRFGERVAVAGIGFRLARGECLGLLGPNGAGKTSTLAMISGIATPDGGTVRLDAAAGRMPLISSAAWAWCRRTWRCSTNCPHGPTCSCSVGSMACARPHCGREPRKRWPWSGLSDRRNDRVKTFSGGMKRRLNIAGALLHDPDLILLDEPTVGVDPQSRNAIFENLEVLKQRGKTLIYTTHYMEEAERLCDRVLIMDHGHVLADDTVAALKAQHGNLEQAFLHLTGRALRDGTEGAAA